MRLIVLAAGWLLGLYLGAQLDLPLAAPIALVPLALAGAALLRRRWRPLLAALFVAGSFGGMVRSDLAHRGPADTLASLHGQEAALRGTVTGDPELRGPVVQLRIAVRDVYRDGTWRSASGRAQVSLRPTREAAGSRDAPYFRRGDTLWLKGRLEAPQPFGDFDFPAYLARQGVRSVMAFPSVSLLEAGRPPLAQRLIASARRRLSASLERALPEPQNGLAQAIGLGLTGDLSPEWRQDFNESGTSHILAVSGLHVAIVLGMTLALARRFPWGRRALMLLLPLGAVWVYAVLAGLSPSAQRAAVMATFYLAAIALGRQRHGLEALLLAAFAITVASPRALWEISFQLSFLAMAGIILVGVPLAERVASGGPDGEGILGLIARSAVSMLVMGLAATLFTWPAVAFYFHRVSLVGVPATALVLPALPFALAASLLTAVVGLASASASWAFGWAAWLLLGYILWVAHVFAALPLASLRLEDVAKGLVWAYYASLAAGLWAMRSASGLRAWLLARLPRPALAMPAGPRVPRFSLLSVGVAGLAAAVWWTALAQPAGRLEVTFLDVGRGDATLVRSPTGETALVDGGGDARALGHALGRALPSGSRRIDVVIATHAHQDHVGGLAEGLRGYRVGAALLPPLGGDSASLAAWRRALDGRGVPQLAARAGQRVALGSQVGMDVLHPPEPPLEGTESDVDNNSIVVRVSYRSVSFLLTGDIQSLAEEYLADERASLSSTVLKVAHHGSRTSSTSRFLEKVRPVAAMIPAEAGNPFEHPHREALERLQAFLPHQAIFHTGRDGWVRFSTDGERLWVKTGRVSPRLAAPWVRPAAVVW